MRAAVFRAMICGARAAVVQLHSHLDNTHYITNTIYYIGTYYYTAAR